ncbi:Six-hairpin glycosidase [Aspergillus mulundensis]|uniref:Six-hairpin glycosidase n=1 Tax=Aspergillus mulundensis TaxID=1810919 RepID=A0A3D8R8T4_9EURO|nr:Six-hairpin glycosidase [Aspergillus mulundensis]RDW70467.1 Six-hairpin glycosidase [Aspergillus mulundensis]
MLFKLRLYAIIGTLISMAACQSTTAPASAFNLSSLTLQDGRFHENQERTLAYLKFIDVESLLYVFRETHNLSTQNATPNGGWDAPDFPFRSHVQGHFLTAWAQCWASLGDETCRDRATYFVAELAKCQANNEAAGFTEGYLSGFPESEFTLLREGRLQNGNVAFYAMHKTLAGLLDVWRYIGDSTALDVLLGLAGWVDAYTSGLSEVHMQQILQTEFGGMPDVLAEIYLDTKDERWLVTAQRFDHHAVLKPLAENVDDLNGLHANTQVPKWIGAVHEYRATGNKTYLDIARNAWQMTVNTHTYAIGGNSQAEHFRAPNAIAGYLAADTCEGCNSINMLKLTRELWLLDSADSAYFEFYENALLNHLLGQQNPDEPHGHVTYFTSLNPGGRRGVGPAWGGGTWSTDYESFWCCQGTALEHNTRLVDSVYFRRDETSTLYVNLFIPSVLDWTEKQTKIVQTTAFPLEDTTTLTIKTQQQPSEWTLQVRIPEWTFDPEIKVNGVDYTTLLQPGTYAAITRTWSDRDTVQLHFPMRLYTRPANDNSSIEAIVYGPTVLCGDYGDSALSSTPTLALDTVSRVESDSTLAFTALANGQNVTLTAFYEAHDFNYNVYWATTGELSVEI